MAEEIRQLYLLIVGLIASGFGALVNYAWLKSQKNEDMTRQGAAKAILVGMGASVLLWVQSSGGDLYYHVAYIGLAFVAGFGGETILGKVIGQYQMSKKIPLIPPFDPESIPTDTTAGSKIIDIKKVEEKPGT